MAEMNDKHLLWWVFKAIDASRAAGTTRRTLLSETMWNNLGAPDWVLPVVRERYAAFDDVPANGERKMEPRMDGTELEQIHWRVLALREALTDITTTDGVARQIARNALLVDDGNREVMQQRGRDENVT